MFQRLLRRLFAHSPRAARHPACASVRPTLEWLADRTGRQGRRPTPPRLEALEHRIVPSAISSVSPNTGSTAGGTYVEIDGSGFSGVSGVSFGSVASQMYYVMGNSQIYAYAPAHAAGAVDVTVTTAGGTSPTSSDDLFTYAAPPPPPAPVVSALSPSSGATAGDSYVLISGSGFSGATAVSFGGAASMMFYVTSDSQIGAYTPSHVAGTVDVTVTTAGGTSAVVGADQFLYVAPPPPPVPAVSAVSPSSGPTTGGSYVTISGSGFTDSSGTSDVTGVSFGGVASQMYYGMGGNTIYAYAPVHAAGVVDVTVTTAGGTSAVVDADQFTYNLVTTTTYLSSSENPATHGDAVTFTATVAASGGTPTGTVVFEDGTTVLGTGTLASGAATFATSALTVGSHNIMAVYGGDAFFAGAVSGAFAQAVVPKTHTWTNTSGDGKASTAANWTNGPILQGDSLIFDGATGSNTNASFDAAFNVAPGNITINNGYTVQVSIDASLTITGALTDTSAQATVAIASGQNFSANQCSLIGSKVNGPGTLLITDLPNSPGSMTVSNGATLSGVVLLDGADSHFNVQGDVSFINGCAATLLGPSAWTNGTITVQNNSTISNIGSWVVTCDQSMVGTPGSSFFNGGSFTKNTTNGQTKLLLAFSNAPVQGYVTSPTVTDNTGTLEFTTNANQAGQFSVSTAGTLLFDSGRQTFTADSQFTGLGSVNLNNVGEFLANSSATVTISVPAFELGGLAFMRGPTDTAQGSGTYTISNTFTWDGGTIVNAAVSANGALKITGNPMVLGMIDAHLATVGQTTYDAAQDISMLRSTIDNTGQFQLKNTQAITDLGNHIPPPPGGVPPTDPWSVFSNDAGGTVTKLAGGLSSFAVVFNNGGTLDFNGLAMAFTANAAGVAALAQTGANSVTDLGGGTMTLVNGMAPGTFNLSGGELTGTAGATISGNLSNSGLVDFGSAFGTLTISGGYTQTGGGSLSIDIGAGGQIDSLNVSGQATVGGHLHINGDPGLAAYDIIHAVGGVTNTFADLTSPLEATYLAHDIFIQLAGG